MRYWPCVQGSDEWKRLRRGKPTSSNFDRIITPGGKPSKAETTRAYARLLLAEELLGYSIEPIDHLADVERGKIMEAQAADRFAADYGLDVLECGFFTNDAGTVGCSPDRLIDGQHHFLEIKVPAPHTHIRYMDQGFGSDYWHQCQGTMWVGEFERGYRYSYHETLRPVREVVERDEPYIAKLAAAMAEFLDMKNEIKERLLASGSLFQTDAAGVLNVRAYTAVERMAAI